MSLAQKFGQVVALSCLIYASFISTALSANVPQDNIKKTESEKLDPLSNKVAQVAQPKKIKVWVNTFIPDGKIKLSEYIPKSIDPCFKGDNRNFSNKIDASSRTHQLIEFDLSTSKVIQNVKRMGKTHKIDCKTGNITETETAPISQLKNKYALYRYKKNEKVIFVEFTTEAKNPLVPLAPQALVPAIDLVVLFAIFPAERKVEVLTKHDGFPAYEFYISADNNPGKLIYKYDPKITGKSPLSLAPPIDIKGKDDRPIIVKTKF